MKPKRMTLFRTIPTIAVGLLALFVFAACDTGGPATCDAPAPGSGPRDSAVALSGNDGGDPCLAVQAVTNSNPATWTDVEDVPIYLVQVMGGSESGPNLRLMLDGDAVPQPGRYPVTALRGDGGRFGPLPVRFAPGEVASYASAEAGEGYWFATGGTVTVDRVGDGAMSGTFEVDYLHGSGTRPRTAAGEFRAELVSQSGGLFQSNPHGG